MIVQFHRLADQELRAAHVWYGQRDANAAARFLTAVDGALARVEADPESHPIERRHFRWVRVRRFPYRLIFECHPEENTILVIALAHARRHPGYWSRRIL